MPPAKTRTFLSPAHAITFLRGLDDQPRRVDITTKIMTVHERQDADARAAEINAMYHDDAATFAAIGERFGITGQRAQQIMVDYGYDLLPRAARVGRRIRRIADDSKTVDEVQRRSGYSRRVVATNLTDEQKARLVLERHRQPNHFTDDDLLKVLREAAAWKIDRWGRGLRTVSNGPLTSEDFDEFTAGRRFDDGRPYPTKQTPMHRWGSWIAAMQAAGLPHNPHGGPSRRFTVEDAYDAIERCWNATDKTPTTEGYETWRRKELQNPEWRRQTPTPPSLATIRNIVPERSWKLAINAVARRRHDG